MGWWRATSTATATSTSWWLTTKGIAWLDNLRQGRFADRTAASGLAAAGPVEAVVSADLDNDGLPDVIAAGNGLTLWRNLRVENSPPGTSPGCRRGSASPP